MTRWIVLPLCIVFAGVAALGLFGAARMAMTSFPDEHDEDLEQ